MKPSMFYASMHNYMDNKHVDCSPQSNTIQTSYHNSISEASTSNLLDFSNIYVVNEHAFPHTSNHNSNV